MFIASSTYVKQLVEVEKYLEEHIAFLDKHYKSDDFVCSGRKNPHTGELSCLIRKMKPK